ncbi:MAG TPA: copper resistance protein B [Stenotrophomonas sp.]|nr:copper resistance protein B [Stenotrophomonas sp.]
MKHDLRYLWPALGALVLFDAVAQDAQHQHAQHDHTQHSQHSQHSQHAEAAAPQPTPAAHVHDTASAQDAQMDHAAMGHAPAQPPSAAPRTPIPVPTAADRAAAVKPPGAHAAHDNTVQSFVLLDRLEAVDVDNGTGLEWEGVGWVGTDLEKLWVRSEGERNGDGHTESANVEALYGRAIAPWWDLVAGVRHDFKPGASQDFAAIGIMGLAPYKFELSATAYIGTSGHSFAQLEAEYETLLTNRLVLQPQIEVTVHGGNDAARGVGSGLGSVEVGLRLRYEITRRFAPYVGVVAERAFGRTAELRREHGEDSDDARLVAGFRIWF